MEIRKASFKDIDEIMQIYDHAKVFMRENGNKVSGKTAIRAGN